MTLLSIEEILPSTKLGVWEIDGNETSLLQKYPHLQKEIQRFSNDCRRNERLSVYALLYEMTGDDSLLIEHNADGKPQLNGYNISISHTKGRAAVLLSKDKTVGVDIEIRSDRVGKIAKRFIRPDEWTDDIDRQLLIWSAKETVYKLFSEQHLELFEMRTNNISKDKLTAENVVACGKLTMENLKCGLLVIVHYRIDGNYVLTWVVK